jgi:hypothetical protein
MTTVWALRSATTITTDLDWFVSSVLSVNIVPRGTVNPIGNRLYRNDGGTFTDVTGTARVAHGGWGWGVFSAIW